MDYHGLFMNYHGLFVDHETLRELPLRESSWTTMDYHELPWTLHGLP